MMIMRQEFDLGPLRDMTWLQLDGGFLYGAHEVIFTQVLMNLFPILLKSFKIDATMFETGELRWVKWKE